MRPGGSTMALSFDRPTLSMPQPTGLLGAIGAFLRRQGWRYQPVAGAPALASRITGRTGTWSCAIAASDDDSHVAVLTIVPVVVPVARRPAMAEYLTRLNYGLGVGSFEMDFADGEVRCKTASVVDGELSPTLMGHLLHWNVDLMDQHAAQIAEAATAPSPAEAAAP